MSVIYLGMSQCPTGVLVSCLFPFFHPFISFFILSFFLPSAPKRARRKKGSVQAKPFFTTILFWFDWPVSGVTHCTSLTLHTRGRMFILKKHTNIRGVMKMPWGHWVRKMLPFYASASSNELPLNECFHGNHIDYFISLPSFFIAARVPLCSASHVYRLTDKSMQNHDIQPGENKACIIQRSTSAQSKWVWIRSDGQWRSVVIRENFIQITAWNWCKYTGFSFTGQLIRPKYNLHTPI